MPDMTPVFRYNVDESKAKGLSQAMAALEQQAFDIPLEHMRAWLSHMTNGEFDAVTVERRDH